MVTDIFRIGVGLLLILVFLVLLLIVASKRSIREEPRGVLVIMLTLLGLIMSSVLFIAATADTITGEVAPLTFCYPLLYFNISAFIGFKMTVFFLAVDQFVSIVHYLRYYTIMSRWINWMIGMVCCSILLFFVFGLACFHFDMENTAEYHRRAFGVNRHLEYCSWEQLAGVFTMSAEVSALVLAIVACVLVIYTAVLGLREQNRIEQENASHRALCFVTSFKSFKYIVKVLLILFVIDLLSCVYRIASRWFPPSTADTVSNLLRFLGLVIECWAYGLGHDTVRSQVQIYLRCRRNSSPLPRRGSGAAELEQRPPEMEQRPLELEQRPPEPELEQRPPELEQRPPELPPVRMAWQSEGANSAPRAP